MFIGSEIGFAAFTHGGMRTTDFLVSQLQSVRGSSTKVTDSDYVADGFYDQTGYNAANSGVPDVVNIVPFMQGSLAGQGSGGASGLNERYIVPGYLLASGYGFKLYFNGGAHNFQLSAVYIGEQASSGDAWDMQSGTIQQVLFGGAASPGLIPPNSGVFASDLCTYNIDPTKTYIISQGITTGTNFGQSITNSPIVNWRFSGGSGNAGVADVTGGSSQGAARYFIDKMEVYTKSMSYDSANDYFAGTWAQMINRGLRATAQGSGNANYCYLQLISASMIGSSADKLKISVDGPTSSSEQIASLRFGRKAASGDAFDFETSPGNVGVSISGNFSPTLNPSTTYLSDAFFFPMENIYDHILAHDIINGTIGRDAGKASYIQDYYRSGITPGSEAATANKTGYSTLAYNTILNRVYGYRNINWKSIAYTATSVPSKIKIVIVYNPIDVPTLNTDLKGLVSRDNGTTLSQVTLTSWGDWPGGGGLKVVEGLLDVSGQPSGTQIVLNVTTHNGKEMPIYAVAGAWQA